MLILGIDTTSEHGGVALCRDLDCLAAVHNAGSSGFSVTLFQMVDRVLAEAGAKLSGSASTLRDIDLLAAANGPGSFTGIRTGLAAVQGWATALKRPVVGISVLAAMAEEDQPKTQLAASIMDARRDEFYLAFFRREEKAEVRLTQDGEGVVLPRNEVVKSLEGRMSSGMPITCIHRDGDAAAQSLQALLPETTPWESVPAFLAPTIARMGFDADRLGKLQTAAQLDALYIRRPDAEVNWRA